MSYGLSKLKVARLLKKIERIDREARGEPIPESERGTDSERALLSKLSTRGKGAKWWRAGWPDYLVEEEGKLFAIEVKKRRNDMLRESQSAIFPLLERLGTRVYVWSPDYPDRLVPWRKWGDPEERRRAAWHNHVAYKRSKWRKRLHNQLAEH